MRIVQMVALEDFLVVLDERGRLWKLRRGAFDEWTWVLWFDRTPDAT